MQEFIDSLANCVGINQTAQGHRLIGVYIGCKQLVLKGSADYALPSYIVISFKQTQFQSGKTIPLCNSGKRRINLGVLIYLMVL